MNTPRPGRPTVPQWLERRLREAGGSVPFQAYMEWVLHDPEHGAYGSGQLSIGPRGDFATAPSLGADFARLLAPQVAQWLALLPGDTPLALVETGPGEGHLALQLAEALAGRLARPGGAHRAGAGGAESRAWSNVSAAAEGLPPAGALV